MNGPTGSDALVTFFSLPAGFEGHTGIIQANAVASWTRVPGARVTLFGEEAGLAETAQNLGVGHEPDIERNELGTPLVSDAFSRARRTATTPLLVFSNADIMFEPSFYRAAQYLAASERKMWLAVGRRVDMDVTEPWDFEGDWAARMKRAASERGTPHGPSGIDFFLFPRDLPIEFPPLAVGRPGWDNWLIASALELGLPVFDLSEAVLCVHQNHPPRYRPSGTEELQNIRMIGGEYNLATIRNATHRVALGADGEFGVRRNYLSALLSLPPVRFLLAFKRRVVRRLAAGG